MIGSPRARQIAVNSADTNGYGQVVLNILMLEPPPNDLFANRLALWGYSAQTKGHTFLAGAELGEPSHAADAATQSVWFAWTAPASSVAGSNLATITAWGSDFDTVLAVYTGDSLASLVPVTSAQFKRASGPTRYGWVAPPTLSRTCLP